MKSNQPNVILIFPDQWRGDCLGAMGHPVVRTPFVDTLAIEGVTFEAAYSPAPTCIATRACLATGKTPSGCGRLGYRDGVPWRYEQTLMHCLARGGYQTINVGKTHFFPQRANLGFEVNRLYDPQRHTDVNFDSDYHLWLRDQAGGAIHDTAHDHSNNTWVPLPWSAPEHLHPTNWTADTAISELKERDPQRPFFLQVGFHRPHPPYDPPVHYLDIYRHLELPPVARGPWSDQDAHHPVDAWAGGLGELPRSVQDDSRRAYFAAITHIDHQVGKLMYWLKQNKLYDNTHIIFCSDHGEMLGDHHRRHKIIPLEGSAHVPLVVKPARVDGMARGTRCRRAVTVTDLMPTILDEAGIELPEGVEARSLSPLLRDPEADWSREVIHGEHAPCWQYLTDGRRKYIWNSITGDEWFFDLEQDPQERDNLVGCSEAAAQVATWRGRLVEQLWAPQRRDDGLSDGEKLLVGVRTPAVRDELLDSP